MIYFITFCYIFLNCGSKWVPRSKATCTLVVTVFIDSELNSKSEKRALRHIKRSNYIKINKGEGEKVDHETMTAEIEPPHNQGEHFIVGSKAP